MAPRQIAVLNGNNVLIQKTVVMGFHAWETNIIVNAYMIPLHQYQHLLHRRLLIPSQIHNLPHSLLLNRRLYLTLVVAVEILRTAINNLKDGVLSQRRIVSILA
jgi:hypothetical protein